MKLLKNSSIYLFSTMLSRAIPFLMLPILTKYLTKDAYGIMSLYGIIINFGTPILGLALIVSATKQFFYLDEKKYNDLLSSIVTLWLIISFIAFFLSFFLVTVIDYKHFDSIFGIIIAFHIFMVLMRNFFLVIIRNKEMPVIYGVFQVTSSILEMAAIWYFVVNQEMSWKGKILGTLSALTLLNIVHLFFFRREHEIKLKINKSLIKDALALSLPIIPNLIAVNIINLSDRLFIVEFWGESENGIYSLAAQLASIVLMLNTAFGKVLIPWIYKSLANKDYKSVYKRLNQYTIAICLFSTIVIPLAWILFELNFINSEFQRSFKYVGILALSFALYSASNLSNNILVNEKETKRSGIVYILGGLLCLLLNFILIPKYAIMGACVATLITCLFLFLGVRFQINKITNYENSLPT